MPTPARRDDRRWREPNGGRPKIGKGEKLTCPLNRLRFWLQEAHAKRKGAKMNQAAATPPAFAASRLCVRICHGWGGFRSEIFPAPNVPVKLSWLGEVTRDRSIERVPNPRCTAETQSERREYPRSSLFLLCASAPLRESLPWPGQPKPILAPASLKAQRRQGGEA